jgi:hypothetical protein
LEGRWSREHEAFLSKWECDVWLLTEVSHRLDGGFGGVIRSEDMGQGKSWAAVWSDRAVRVKSPHEAAAFARVDDALVCSAVLPWRGAAPAWPDKGVDLAAITSLALQRLLPAFGDHDGRVIWGGDWNHAFSGREWVGSLRGRKAIENLADQLDLNIATRDCPHREAGAFAIDHVAVPRDWVVEHVDRGVAIADGLRLSDHDAYVVDVRRPV